MQLVILAGGFGTRLRGAIPDGLPKPMAPISGRPFLEHLLDRAIGQGVKNVHLLVGHRSDVIVGHFGSDYRGADLTYHLEDEPLGTGGALKAAIPSLADRFVVANGDTYANVDYNALLDLLDWSPLAMSLANIDDASRYGSVLTREDVVVGFREKVIGGPGMINAGVYACSSDLLTLLPPRKAFSFESDFLEVKLAELRPKYVLAGPEIIDIGIPESYEYAKFVIDGGAGH